MKWWKNVKTNLLYFIYTVYWSVLTSYSIMHVICDSSELQSTILEICTCPYIEKQMRLFKLLYLFCHVYFKSKNRKCQSCSKLNIEAVRKKPACSLQLGGVVS